MVPHNGDDGSGTEGCNNNRRIGTPAARQRRRRPPAPSSSSSSSCGRCWPGVRGGRRTGVIVASVVPLAVLVVTVTTLRRSIVVMSPSFGGGVDWGPSSFGDGDDDFVSSSSSSSLGLLVRWWWGRRPTTAATSRTTKNNVDEAVLMGLLGLSSAGRTVIDTDTKKKNRVKGRRERGGGDGFGKPSTPGNDNDDSDKDTLALLFPPGLQGGYRNQVLRFVALCHRALQHNQTLYLPSLWWSTQRRRKVISTRRRNGNSSNGTDQPHSSNNDASKGYVWFPVPMDLIFDVPYWNDYATSYPRSLPRLVHTLPSSTPKDPTSTGDCWSNDTPSASTTIDVDEVDGGDFLQRELLRRGFLTPLANYTLDMIRWPPPVDEPSSLVSSFNPRRHDLLPLVSHCQRPFVYGGGTQAGRLWNEYLGLSSSTTATSSSALDDGVYASVLRALQPKPGWRKVAQQHCLRRSRTSSDRSNNDGNGNGNGNDNDKFSYAVLHARIEPEMMAHPCGRSMERNLTLILDRVARFLRTNHTMVDGTTHVTKLVVAVSRDGLVDPRFPQFQDLSAYNLKVLDRYTAAGTGAQGDGDGRNRSSTSVPRLLHDRYRVLECGGEMMARYYRSLRHQAEKAEGGDTNGVYEANGDVSSSVEDVYGTLLEQVINFDVAVQSNVFVGVDQSSYSNAVWTTRFLLRKGSNYRYTTTGIEEVVGMPPPHSNCARGSGPRTNRKQPKKKGR